MKADNPIKLGIDAALRGEGFSRKGSTWLCEREEAILVIELQKSNFGAQYYVNLGVYVKGLTGSEATPPRALKEQLCDIRVRVDALGESKTTWKPILDLEDTSLSATDRQMKAEELMRRTALFWLKMCSTRQGLPVAQAEGRLKGALINKRVRDLLT